ncbi:DUF6571 family protein [Streptomyces sp. NPDC046887]|uniref:DUF6571 family protein n=1 Tax=Streptomyces sp. NPDC046887 TaxID=3155472 RepID=UPI0033F78047
MDFESLHSANFAKLDDTVTDWTSMLAKLKNLERDAHKGLKGMADKANWAGYNAAVSREFIGKTAGEFADAHTQATSIRDILQDTRDELKAQQRLLREAVERGRGQRITVKVHGHGFTVEADPGAKDVAQKQVDTLRDELLVIIDKATEIDSTAATSLKALVDLTDYGFTDAKYKDRDSAAAAIRTAEKLAKVAAKDLDDLTVDEFDQLNAGLAENSGDQLFAERFAEQLGAKGVLEFWAGVNDRGIDRDLATGRRDQFDDLQKHLGLTLAAASQADTPEMAKWKREMTDLGGQPVGQYGFTRGFQVMSNLMRWGDYDDTFLNDYGRALMKVEKEASDNGRHAAWMSPAHMGPSLNRTGTDSGSDPLVGYLKALSNNPGAGAEFFNEPFLTKDDDHEFERDTDGDTFKGKVGLSNFQYLFEERHWPPEVDTKGEDSIEGRNNLALALEAAATGHGAGEMPTTDTPAHSREQARLVESIVTSVSQVPDRLLNNGYMSDSLGRITAEYMPDVHRGLHAGKVHEPLLFPASGETAKLDTHDLTRFLYTVGQNPEGYAAVSVGQHSYTANLMQYHFAHPQAHFEDPALTNRESLKETIHKIAETSGEVQGTIGAGRAYANEVEGGEADKKFNDGLETASTWISSGIGIGIGVVTTPTVGPGGLVAGGVAGTAADEILSALTEGLMKDSSDEVIYRNGKEISDTQESTYNLLESAAQKAAEHAGNPASDIVSGVGTAAERGFVNAHASVSTHMDGQGLPRELDKKKE